MYIYLYTYVHIHTLIYTHTSTLIHSQIHTLLHMHTYIHTLSDTHTHTYAHMHTHAHSYSDTQTRILSHMNCHVTKKNQFQSRRINLCSQLENCSPPYQEDWWLELEAVGHSTSAINKQSADGKWGWASSLAPSTVSHFSSEATKGSITFQNSARFWRLSVQMHEPVEAFHSTHTGAHTQAYTHSKSLSYIHKVDK